MNNIDHSALKIHISSTDKYGSKLLYEHIVYEARSKGIAGVTVYRGIMGYGTSSRQISTSRYWELTEKLPVLIEMIDETSKLKDFCRLLDAMLPDTKKGALVTLEPLKVMIQRAGTSLK